MTPTKREEPKEDVVFIMNLLSGSMATIASRTATAPLDRVKLILQTRDPTIRPQYRTRYGTIVSLLNVIWKKQGFLSLWRGNTMNIIKNLPSQALIFSVQGFIFNRISYKKRREDLTSREVFWFSFLSGGGAAAATIFTIYPVYMCQTVVSSHASSLRKAKFNSLWGCARYIYKYMGIFGFYRGFTGVSCSVVVNRSIYFGVYDFYKKFYDVQTLFFRFVGGMMSTSIAGFVAYPMETIGRRMAVRAVNREPDSLKSIVKDIYKLHGLTGLYRGALVNVFRSFGGALLLVLHDDIYKAMMSHYYKAKNPDDHVENEGNETRKV